MALTQEQKDAIELLINGDPENLEVSLNGYCNKILSCRDKILALKDLDISQDLIDSIKSEALDVAEDLVTLLT